MRRRVAAVLCAGVVAMITTIAAAPAVTEDAPAAAPAVVAQRVHTRVPAIRDEAAMVLVGAALIALAGALRRAA
jgi:hypothetical protein